MAIKEDDELTITLVGQRIARPHLVDRTLNGGRSGLNFEESRDLANGDSIQGFRSAAIGTPDGLVAIKGSGPYGMR